MEILYSVISFVLGVGVVMPYIVKLQNVLKEVAELVEVVKESPEGGFNNSDTEKIVKEAKDVWEAVKAFKKK